MVAPAPPRGADDDRPDERPPGRDCRDPEGGGGGVQAAVRGRRNRYPPQRAAGEADGGRREPRDRDPRRAAHRGRALAMAGQVQALRRRIRTVRSTKKTAKAQGLVAPSRIAKAQERVAASRPYAEAITRVLTALASNATLDNPLLTPRPSVRRAGVLLITSDRGLAGAYNANAIRTTEQLIARLRADGKQVALYVVGRKGVTYYRFRNREIEASWTGFSERPTFEDARMIGESLIAAFTAGAEVDEEELGPENVRGVDELHIVNTQFKSLMTQT